MWMIAAMVRLTHSPMLLLLLLIIAVVNAVPLTESVFISSVL